MDWLTEYLELILPVALVLLYLFQRAFAPHQDEEGGPAPGDEDAEARRIREEIRRKIVARQQGRTEEGPEPQRREAYFPERQPQQSFEGGSFQEAPPPLPRERRVPEPQVAPPASPGPYRDLESELREQRERVKQAKKAREEAIAKAGVRQGEVGAPVLRRGRRSAVAMRGGLLNDLRTTDSLRRAFVLKEVLDRPVGLRETTGSFANFG